MKLLLPRAALAAFVLLSGSVLSADEYEDLRLKWVNGITGGNYTLDAALSAKIAAQDTLVTQLRSEMTPGTVPANGYLFPGANEVAASLGEYQRHAHITKTYENLAKMALALRTKGSTYEFIGTGSALAQATRDDVKRGLAWMLANAYQNNTIIATPGNPLHNWWDLEIGATGWLGTILCCLNTGPFLNGANGGLDQTAINAYSRPMILKLRNRTLLNGSGANGAWRARTWTYLGILRKNLDENLASKNYLGEARDRLDGFLAQPPPTVHNFDSEGFHADGMFIGHIFHPYTAGYGAQMIDRLIELDEFYTGTSWATDGTLKASMLAWISAADLTTFRMQFFQNVHGRALTRYRTANTTAAGLCLTTIWVSETALPATQQVLRELVKNWLDSAPAGYDLRNDPNLTIAQYLRAKRYYDNHFNTTTPLPANDTYKQFTHGSTAVALRPGYGASVSMFTADNVGETRPHIKSNETLGTGTLQGAFLGSGALQVLTSDTDAFANGYYENLDWQRIPGTTIDSTIQPTGERYENATNWAGGASLGRYGVTGFQLQPKAGTSADNLGKFHARKAWFFFDKEIVALGVDIRRTDTTVQNRIHTTIENRKIRPDNANTFKIDSSTTPGIMQTRPTTLSASNVVVSGATRAWVSGNTAGTDMGYYFPVATEVTYRRLQRDTVPPSPAPVPYVSSAKYLQMWINHGIPSAGAYRYVLLPNFTEAQTNAYAAAPEITVLENSADAQAVRKPSLGLTGALFLKDQAWTVNEGASDWFLRSNKSAAVMVEETAHTITLNASDPTWQNTGTMTIELDRSVSGWEQKTTGITVDQTTPSIKMTVATNGAKGKTFSLVLHKRFEPERGGFLVANSGDVAITYTNEVDASNGGIVSYNADAAADYVTYKLWHQLPGTYRVIVRYKTGSNRAQVGLRIGADQVTMNPQGNQNYETYSASTGYVDADLGLVTFSAAGDRFFKFTANGKHGSSSSYRIVLDSIQLVPQ